MKPRTLLILVTAACAAVALRTLSVNKPSVSPHFNGLGDLAGGEFYSSAQAVSADGAVVVGTSHSEAGIQVFRWTADEGMQGLGFQLASGVSADGSVVVGFRHIDGRGEPVRWTLFGDVESVLAPELSRSGAANGISADGSIIVGSYAPSISDRGNRDMAFRWTRDREFAHLPQPDGNAFSADAHAVSADGTTIVGAIRRPTGHDEAFRWTTDSSPVGLGCLPGHTTSVAHGISADGVVVVGTSSDYITTTAFRWTKETGMVPLGTLPGGGRQSAAYATSADGSIIVGYCATEGGWDAFIWDEGHGMRSIRRLLIADYQIGDTLRHWKLRSALAVSADGAVVVGFGINPAGHQEAWLACLTRDNKPAAALLTNAALVRVPLVRHD